MSQLTDLKPFAVTFTDGYYSVRQARDEAHARDLSKERHPEKVIQSIRQVQ